MEIDLTGYEVGNSDPLKPIRVYSGSAFPVSLRGIPKSVSGADVVGVRVIVTNADGVPVEAAAAAGHGVHFCRFAPSCFERYGFVGRGFVVKVDLEREDGNSDEMTYAVGDFEVMAASPDVQPGDTSRFFQRKGDDEYHVAFVVDGVRHYKRVEIAYDEEMGAWGFNLVGDYVLVDGEFVDFES